MREISTPCGIIWWLYHSGIINIGWIVLWRKELDTQSKLWSTPGKDAGGLGRLDPPWSWEEKRNSYILQTLLMYLWCRSLLCAWAALKINWAGRKCLSAATCHSYRVIIKWMEDILAGVSTFCQGSSKNWLRCCKTDYLPGAASRAILCRAPHYKSSMKDRLPSM